MRIWGVRRRVPFSATPSAFFPQRILRKLAVSQSQPVAHLAGRRAPRRRAFSASRGPRLRSCLWKAAFDDGLLAPSAIPEPLPALAFRGHWRRPANDIDVTTRATSRAPRRVFCSASFLPTTRASLLFFRTRSPALPRRGRSHCFTFTGSIPSKSYGLEEGPMWPPFSALSIAQARATEF